MTSVAVGANSEGKITVQSPYCRDFVDGAKRLAGKWDDTHKVWVFDARDEARVRALCGDVYGTDGTDTERVVLRIHVPKGVVQSGPHSGIFLTGRCVARSRFPDGGGPQLGDDVVVLEGKGPVPGGTARYPGLEIPGHTVMEVRNVPVAAARRAVENPWKGCRFEIVD